MTLPFIQRGKPHQHAYIKRFKRTWREEAQSAYLFDSFDEVSVITSERLERQDNVEAMVNWLAFGSPSRRLLSGTRTQPCSVPEGLDDPLGADHSSRVCHQEGYSASSMKPLEALS